MNKKIIISFFILNCLCCYSFAQSERDSLLNKLKAIYIESNNFDKYYPIARNILKKSIENKDTQLIALSYQRIADLFWYKSVYSTSEDYYFKSLEIIDSAKYPSEYAYALYSIGWIECIQKGREDKIGLLKRSIRINYLLKDTANIIANANALSGAYLYFYKKDTLKIQYLDSSIIILENIIRQFSNSSKWRNQMNRIKSNLGGNYLEKKIYHKAYQYIHEALSSESVKKSKRSYYFSILNKIKVLYYLNHKDSVDFYLKHYLPELEKLDDEVLIELYMFLYRYEKANKNYFNALNYLEKYKEVYERTNAHLLTLKYEELEANKEIFKKEQAIQNLQKQKEIEQVKNRQKNIIISVIFLSLVIIIVFLRKSVLQNKKIKQLNTEIIFQKNILEQKNKDILDSINYASRIQKALITPNHYIQHHFISENFFKEYFTLYLPKDIVSGDFYWANVNFQNAGCPHYLAVCDCTGHGVPGAFMSLLNINYLTEAVQERQLYFPNDILNYVRKKLIDNLSYDEQQKDGMDASIIMMDKRFPRTKKLYYALANHLLVIVRETEVVLLQGDKMPVGKGHYTEEFRLFQYDLKEDDRVYLFTDGYKDQFGGEKGKRIMQKQFIQLLKESSGMRMQEQKKFLEDFFIGWKKENEQTDDVCIVGFKI